MDYTSLNYDEGLLEQIVAELRKQADEIANKNIQAANMERFKFGIVKSADNTSKTALVKFSNYSGEFSDTFPNMCGEDLTVGDTVKVFYDNDNMKNAYIKIRYSIGGDVNE